MFRYSLIFASKRQVKIKTLSGREGACIRSSQSSELCLLYSLPKPLALLVYLGSLFVIVIFLFFTSADLLLVLIGMCNLKLGIFTFQILVLSEGLFKLRFA